MYARAHTASPWPRPHPPAPLPRPRPLPRTPMLMLMPVARNAGGALCAVRGALRNGRGAYRPASVSIASTRVGVQHSAPPAPPALATVTRTPTQTNLAPNHAHGAREGAQCGTCRSGTPCAWVHRSPSRDHWRTSPRTALFSQHCLMLSRRAVTLIWLSQKRQNYQLQFAICCRQAATQYKT